MVAWAIPAIIITTVESKAQQQEEMAVALQSLQAYGWQVLVVEKGDEADQTAVGWVVQSTPPPPRRVNLKHGKSDCVQLKTNGNGSWSLVHTKPPWESLGCPEACFGLRVGREGYSSEAYTEYEDC